MRRPTLLLVVLLACLGLVLGACGGDDDGSEGAANDGGSASDGAADGGDGGDERAGRAGSGIPSCDLFSLADAEALLGVDDLIDESYSSDPNHQTCMYRRGLETGRVVWTVLTSDVEEVHWASVQQLQGTTPVEGVGDEAVAGSDSLYVRIGDRQVVTSVVQPDLDYPEAFDVEASIELANTIIDAL